jgi:hypothetical protein
MEELKIFRRQEVDESNFLIGDQISISLKGFGDFIATAHKITDKGSLFIFNDYVASRHMNKTKINWGGYNHSDLKEWMDTVVFDSFPEHLKKRIFDLSIPTVGEMFGWNNKFESEYFEKDSDEQLVLMKNRKNRIALFNNDELLFGWLRNAMRKDYSSKFFAYVGIYGDASYENASYPLGVRPEFWLK